MQTLELKKKMAVLTKTRTHFLPETKGILREVKPYYMH